ncbi:midasin [[Candida] anglica]|uniref:Midasin n=1 Tax=[Candida] anglica TaxID=148631 RepID=A0ABP0E9B3_9ASCO
MKNNNNNIVVNARHSEHLLKVFQTHHTDGERQIEPVTSESTDTEVKSIDVSTMSFAKFNSIEENLDNIALAALKGRQTLQVLYAYQQISLEIISRWICHGFEDDVSVLCALARSCGPFPESASLAEHFLDKNKNILQQRATSNATLESLLLAFYRLMAHDTHRFKRFVFPEVLYGVLENVSTTNIAKYLTVEIISIYLNASETSRHTMIANHVEKSSDSLIGSYDDVVGIDFTFLALIEAKRLSNFANLPKIESTSTSSSYIIEPKHLSPLVVSVCGVLVPKLLETKHNAASTTDIANIDTFVPTDSAVNVLRQLAAHIQQNHPIMLHGSAGAGKSFLISELARRMSYEHAIVKIHLGEQTDAKLLLGTYASGEKPGTFQWRAGVLTTAVQQGRWVVIEDIDQAPTEVLSVLLTLLEKKELTIPSRGEIIKAANGFQLISTVRTANEKSSLPDLIGLRLWDLVHVSTPAEVDLRNILQSRFPILGRFIARFIKCFNEIVRIYSTNTFITLNRGSHPRVISFRDLMKLCSRCNAMFANEGITSIEGSVLLSSHIYDQIFAEAVDCFGSAITEHAALVPLVNTIGEHLEIPTSRINLFMTKHVPTFINNDESLKIGRAVLPKSSADKALNIAKSSSNFARTNHSLRLMEQIGVCIQMVEPVLLVGETGTGKTTVVQQVARMMNKKLTVINVSQQTESGDLLGGYKPVNTKTVAVPLQEIFENLFIASFSKKKNEKFAQVLTKCFNKSQWKNVIKLWREAVKMAKTTLVVEDVTPEPETGDNTPPPSKKRKLSSNQKAILLEKWVDFESRVQEFELQVITLDSSFIFNFVEGSLVKAVRNGEWLLLDEINLASSDTLESIADLLSETLSQRSVLLTERGDVEAITAHPEFRIFGCMNPSTDVGKRDLPPSIRSRFSELYVHSPDKDINDLLSIIDQYIGRFAVADEWVGNDIAELYLEAKKLSESNKIVDGANQRPHFSIRTLTRTLVYVCDIVSIYGLRRALYEGFCMSYLTLLDATSEQVLHEVIVKYTLGRLKNAKSVMRQTPPSPEPASQFVQFKHYWMKRGPSAIVPQPHYIITPFVEKNMLNLVRATAGRRFPVLVQGPTSAGKTSMINYLANITGHQFVRINNHEHTDLQEYLGTYMSDSTGKLVFKEGVLVEALRKGHWIVLDELNLAPTDVLEALNRLLDDNRELFIPETQEVIRPHPDFMLFATQNPPGLYGGRKFLSRAFRNRFLELHFDDIPQDELEVILRERCQIAPTYGKKIVEVYRQLSIQRQSTRLFEQKNSFATLRDLFRWALREAVGYEELAANGYMLLAERVRKPEEKAVVKATIEKVMRVTLDIDAYYSKLEEEALKEVTSSNSLGIVWTKAMRRLAVLVHTSMKYKEPLLLVGETGCGKTTVCQIIAQYLGRRLVTVNAHQNTETGDILGAQRPVRHRFETQSILYNNLLQLYSKLNVETDLEESNLENMLKKYDTIKDKLHEDESLKEDLAEIDAGRRNASILFEWNDGPLVQAMKNGDFFLLDEISLADDSVLERLNSVLEPERSLLLAEKGNDDSFVTAAENFEFLATMNPGGDYGKKELSPALRNRFTEIWVPSMEDFNDVRQIVGSKLNERVSNLAEPVVQFSEWYGKTYGSGNASSGVISLRDILAWVQFINACDDNVNVDAALLHGAAMVFVDALGTNNTAYLAESEKRLNEEKRMCVKKLSEFAGVDLLQYYGGNFKVIVDNEKLTSGFFSIAKKESTEKEQLSFNLEAPTTAANTMRVIRAMQVSKPILLEGSPGVGKTSLVSALAKATGNPLVRINLSEQTDLVDLFGSDAPAEGGKTGEFVWRDAPFLRAMQRGEWVLLDEMNLASQSVLEGLNACLDHRGSAYIPELDKTFERHPGFVVFAAQNPQYQGGGRKGLPKSFVNRFSVVYVDVLKEQDLSMISQHLYPQVDPSVNLKMIKFISRLEEEVSVRRAWGHSGGPWEFNLRDTLRWLDLYSTRGLQANVSPADFLDMVVLQRFRTPEDRQKASNLYKEVFGTHFESRRDNYYSIGKTFVQAGAAVISRRDLVHHSTGKYHKALQCNFGLLESAIRCINLNLPLILTGPTKSGKTELIRFLADAVGSQIDEFAMNSDVDSMDILGGYEQVDLERGVTKLSLSVRAILVEVVLVNLKQKQTDSAVLKNVLAFIKFLDESRGDASERSVQLHSNLEQLLKLYSNSELQSILQESHILQKKLSEQKNNGVRFEWFDGLLVQAVENGHWLVLDNANLCSPSVLDRLNSLLETNGTLVINECSSADGQPRNVKPHPNFRLFLTVDPRYGELSRAMRNRGVELFVDGLDERMTTFDMKTSVSSFVSTHHSTERSFALMQDMIDASGTDETLVSTIVGTLPFDNVPLASSWRDLVLKSPEFGTKSKTFAQNLIDMSQNIDVRALQTVYSSASEELAEGIVEPKEIFFEHQTLHPLLNSYLLQEVSPQPTFYFLAAAGVWEINSLVEQLEQRALGRKLGELSYIERSTAFQLGRSIKKPPRLNVYRFVVRVQEFISLQLKDTSCDFQRLADLQLIMKCILDHTAQLDESKFRVYQDLVRQWISRDEENQTLNPLKEAVELLGVELSLSTGSSMGKIWENFRSNHPSSALAWKQTQELFKLAEQFDKVASEQFADSAEAVSALRSVIVDCYTDIVNTKEAVDEGVFLKFCDDLSSGIAKLKEVSSDFIIKRHNVFKYEFSLLANFVEVAKSGGDLATLSALAGRSTIMKCHASISESVEFSPYPKIFDSLWSDRTSHVSGLFSNELIENSLFKTEKLSNGPGKNLEQNLSDISTYANQLISASQSSLSDTKLIFKKLLVRWFVEIANVHLDEQIIVEDISTETIRQYIELTRCSADESFIVVAEKYLFPALFLIIESTDVGTLGRSWVLFACGAIQLYVPSSAFDPAIADHVVYSRFERHQKHALSLIENWRVAGSVLSGDKEILAESLLPESEQAPAKPRVFRPENSTIDHLFDEWTAFMTSTIDAQAIESLLEKVEEDQQLEMFQNNSTQFLVRLNQSYFVYSDLNDILRGFVYGMKLGFDLISMDVEQQQAKYGELHSTTWPVDAVNLASSSKIIKNFETVKDFAKSFSLDSQVPEHTMIFFIRLCFAHGPEALQPVLQQAFQTLYYRWSLRRMKKDEEEAESGNLYRYADPTSDIEGDFRALFPDFEDVMDDVNFEGSSKGDFDEIYSVIGDIYMSSYADNKSDSLPQLVAEGSKLHTMLHEHSKRFKKGISDHSDSALTSFISLLSTSFNSFRNPVTELDFYRGSSPSESKKSIGIVTSIQAASLKLLSQWPEHATLQSIARTTEEFLTFPINTPLARLLQKIEQIYTYISEWEKFAHSQVSLKTHFDTLTHLIVSWRKLELSTWKALFTHEDSMVSQSLGKWWFHLFETIVVPEQDDDLEEDEEIHEEVKVLAALNVFMSQSTYGEFCHRLRLLKSFKNHVGTNGGTKYQALTNFITFYEQFVPVVSDHIAAQRKKLEKDVNEVILLASWKDVNIDALKQSARRSHNNLYKVVRKYRALLATPVSSIIESGLSPEVKVKANLSELPPFTFSNVTENSEVSKICSSVSSWNERPKRLQNIDLVSKNMSVYVKRVGDEEVPSLYTYAKELVEEMDRLRRETPKELKKDNKKVIAALLVQKRKLLSDTIRELRRIGLKTSLRADIHKMQATVNLMLCNSKSFEEQPALRGSDVYYFRILDLMPRLRAAVGSLAEDVPQPDAEKGLAAAENLVFSLATTREPLSKYADSVVEMEKMAKSLETVTNSSLLRSSMAESAHLTVHNIQETLQWTAKLIDFAIESIQAAGTFHKIGSSALEVFYNAKGTISSISNKLDKHDPLVATCNDVSLVQEFREFSLQFVSTLNEWKIENFTLSFIADTVLQWMSIQGTSVINSNTSVTSVEHLKTVEDVELCLRNLSNSIILAVQRVTECQTKSQEEDDAAEDDDNWLLKTQQLMMKYVKSTNHRRVLYHFNTVLQAIASVEHSEQSSKVTAALTQFSLPLVKHYFDLITTVLNKVRSNYVDMSRGTYILSSSLHILASKGFCSPEPPTEQKEDDNLHDGTGLGDGEGATNNSKDVEDDEDLTEDAQQPNEEDKEKDENEDENDDAVDIEGDMAGELEDASDQDKDDEDEDEEGEDMDEEIDDIDDLDPNAIDDKMWDEEAQEDSKEKDTENMPDNSTKDEDDMKANEEEDAKENKNKPENSEDSKNEEEKDEEEDKDDGEEGDDEKDVGEQEDEVKNEENEQLEDNVPETDALDLPDDMNLDSGDEKSGDDEEDGEDFDDKMDVDMEEDKKEAEQEDENAGEEDEEEIDVNAEAEAGEEDAEDQDEDENADPEEDAGADGETAEDPAEEGLESDEETLGDKNEDENDEEEGGNDDDGDQEKAEGVDGANEDAANEEMDVESAVKQESGEKGEGSDNQAMEENTDVGATGGASSDPQQDMDKNEEKNNDDDARDMARESLKQLGDSLKEFHRRRQEIQEASTREEEEETENKANERPDEFEHLDGENADFDTQALGAADQDQVQSIDEDKAIDDEVEDNNIKQEDESTDDTAAKENEDDKMEVDNEEVPEVEDKPNDEQDADFEGKKRGLLGNEKTEVNEDDEFNMNGEFMDVDSSEDEEVEGYVGNDGMSDLPPIEIDEARELWKNSELATQDLASGLCEQLRLILEPTLATKLRGDYKTGKRLNMKRIIPYIASDFRKDKIWLRRTKPSKRQYQIMIAIDDSKSMSESKSTELAFHSIALVSKALTQLESGGLSIVRFGEDVKVVHPFDRPFNNQESGARIFQWFDFQQTRTDITSLCKKSLHIFEDAKSSSNADLWQLQIILSDGVCEDHETVQRLVRRAREQKIMLVFVVIDGINSNESILDMSQVSYNTDPQTGTSKMQVRKYLDTFPFEFYVIVRNINELPEMLSLILRQYFSEMASA